MKNTSAEHLKALISMEANNDDSESIFGLLDDIIFIMGHGDIHKAAGQAMCWRNNGGKELNCL